MPARNGGFDGFGSDQDAGLLGPLIVTRKGAANAEGRPTDVDREFVIVMGVHDENDSPYLRKNVWEKVVEPAINDARPAGFLAFGPSDKASVLQALYARCAHSRAHSRAPK
jgi:fructose-specific component phosphotransferase system IIB-like protein